MPIFASQSTARHRPHATEQLASARERLIVALDVPDASSAVQLVSRLEGACTWFKVGLELFVAAGPAVLIDQLERCRARQETAGVRRFAGVSEGRHGPSLQQLFSGKSPLKQPNFQQPTESRDVLI